MGREARGRNMGVLFFAGLWLSFIFKEKEEKQVDKCCRNKGSFGGVAQDEVGKVRRQSLKGLGS